VSIEPVQLSGEQDIDDETVNTASDIVALKDSLMTPKEIRIRDAINKELSSAGFHVRVAMLTLSGHHPAFDYVQPIDQWFGELRAADELITEKLKAHIKDQDLRT